MSSKSKPKEGKNNVDSISDSQIQSANSWETADLGDKQRNEKFLRLMGASKKEHHGKIVIGDHKPVHKRENKEEKHLADELEEQYSHSMEHRLVGGRKGHLGLGYHPESEEEGGQGVEEIIEETKGDEKAEEDPIVPAERTDSEDVEESVRKREARKKSERDRTDESLDESSESHSKKMKFVKSS